MCQLELYHEMLNGDLELLNVISLFASHLPPVPVTGNVSSQLRNDTGCKAIRCWCNNFYVLNTCANFILLQFSRIR